MLGGTAQRDRLMGNGPRHKTLREANPRSDFGEVRRPMMVTELDSTVNRRRLKIQLDVARAEKNLQYGSSEATCSFGVDGRESCWP